MLRCCLVCQLLVIGTIGCGGSVDEGDGPSGQGVVDGDPATGSPTDVATSPTPSRTRRAPVQLGGGDTGVLPEPGQAGVAGLESVMQKMKPLQVVLGQWQGITQKKQDLVLQRWVWDLRTDPDQPALVLSCPESTYFQKGRLTWLASARTFQFTTTIGDAMTVVYQGQFSQVPKLEPGDSDDTPQQTFKLQLTETTGEKNRRVVLNQQENNRLLLELSRRRGQGTFRRQDTIAAQRTGTSFAKKDSDYGERTCVISQGLGTIAVSYKGKSFWVCCSGCKAAFEEEPEKWIARFEAMKKKNK